jgi:hypothetical protein
MRRKTIQAIYRQESMGQGKRPSNRQTWEAICGVGQFTLCDFNQIQSIRIATRGFRTFANDRTRILVDSLESVRVPYPSCDRPF